MTSPAQTINILTRAEVNKAFAADARRVIRNERMALTVAVNKGENIAAAHAEAVRVAKMWGVEGL